MALRGRSIRRRVGALALLLSLAACADLPAPATPTPVPRPPDLNVTPEQPAPPPVSARSRALSEHYTRFEARQVARGLLRTDGGGIDTPFNARMLQENFERIAFFDEYARGAGLNASDGTPGRLKRWSVPIRFTVEHGDWATADRRAEDRAEIARFVTRLREITGHPMRMSDTDPNFHVIFADADETDTLDRRILEIVPNVNPASLQIFEDLPRAIHCLVIAFSSAVGGHEYTRAIAIIRAEHPPLMRRACIHEEIAQGLGLANDSPKARPSIFNDDDEFALLTTHDALLLGLLYDPDLRPGMTLEAARPLIREKSAALLPEGQG